MTRRPNILILLTDQQRFDTIAAAGFPHMITPNLDRLVREGCTFTRAYSPNPICVPARHYLLTGAPAHLHGYHQNAHAPIRDPRLPTLPRVFSENGYRTALIGKGHFYPPTEPHGYQEAHLMEELPRAAGEDAYLQFLAARGHGERRNIHGVRPVLYHEPQTALVAENELGPAWVGQRACEWIRANAGDQPFLLSCHWIKPHPPWNIPESKAGLYAGAELPEPIPGRREPPFPTEPSDLYGDHDSPGEKRKIREAYFTTITMVDEAVGEILRALEEKGILDDTLILFSSDHGEMLQDRGYYQKMLPFESSARVPFVIRYPARFTPGSTRDDLVDLMDVFPTCIDAAGIDFHNREENRPYRLFGGSLLPGSASPWKRDPDHQFCESLLGRNRWVMMRNRRFKYICFFGGGAEYLFDMERDPTEQHNLLADAEYPREVYADLKHRALEHEMERGPGGTVRDGTFVIHPGNHPPFDWNNNDKYPRWCFNNFQTFGQTDHEAELFLDEWDRVTRDKPRTDLNRIPLRPEAIGLLADGMRKLGGDSGALLRRLRSSEAQADSER